ncbi:hypothetical protein B0H14DRAFT_3439375 [Mycena olivaceomarginata]|nr:hypothetical protein B0H14DRAFT_3439375 [Mycena olivaceomarginata]
MRICYTFVSSLWKKQAAVYASQSQIYLSPFIYRWAALHSTQIMVTKLIASAIIFVTLAQTAVIPCEYTPISLTLGH